MGRNSLVPSFHDALRSDHVLLMDGGMGTELQKFNLQPEEGFKSWNVLHPERVASVHRAYAEAGADTLLTNTFQVTQAALERRKVSTSTSDIAAAAVALAQQQNRWVLGDIGPFDSSEDVSDLIAALSECDALLVETVSNVTPVAMVLKVNEGRLPVLASATFLRDDQGIRTFEGLSPEEWAREVDGLMGVRAIGVNCGRDIGMKECVEIVQRFRDSTHLPIFARPNAGTPKFRNETWVYPHSPAYMASWLPELLAAGATMIGGCCGTTPAHIAGFRMVINAWNGVGDD